ncbi:MAG: hypothetical protein GC204_08985 [Chloroflexi bacterium]|nr:hypothetical protein [Chloroflexota bacterium]
MATAIKGRHVGLPLRGGRRMGVRQKIGELIGGNGRIRLRQINGYTPTRDFSTADYRYWDAARRSKARGLEISGLLLKPLASKAAAWVLGDPPEWSAVGARAHSRASLQNDVAGTMLNDWWAAWHPDILRGYEEALNLGDCYLVVNADLSVTVVPPHVVDPLLDGRGDLVGWRIREVTPHPLTPSREQVRVPQAGRGGTEGRHTGLPLQGSVTIIDEYTALERVRRVERGGVVIQTERFANLIGLIPVIHIANRSGADEFFGRPEGAALIPALQRYGDVIDAAIRGNIRQGRPTPVIERMGTADQVRKFWEKFGRRETQTLPDGSTESVDVIDFDPDQLLTLGGEASFRYAAPGAFTGDTATLLGLLYALIVEHSEIPEFVLGTAVSSSKASVETQLQPFVKWIEKKRGLAGGWMRDLSRVVLAYAAVSDWRIDAATPLAMNWKALTESDGRLTLDTATWAHGAGLIDDEGARQLLAI